MKTLGFGILEGNYRKTLIIVIYVFRWKWLMLVVYVWLLTYIIIIGCYFIQGACQGWSESLQYENFHLLLLIVMLRPLKEIGSYKSHQLDIVCIGYLLIPFSFITYQFGIIFDAFFKAFQQFQLIEPYWNHFIKSI